jgi:hypothetical protein
VIQALPDRVERARRPSVIREFECIGFGRDRHAIRGSATGLFVRLRSERNCGNGIMRELSEELATDILKSVQLG